MPSRDSLLPSTEVRFEDGGTKALSNGFGIGFKGDQRVALPWIPGVIRLGEYRCGSRGDPLLSVKVYTDEGIPLTTFKVWNGIVLDASVPVSSKQIDNLISTTYCLAPCSLATIDCAIALAC